MPRSKARTDVRQEIWLTKSIIRIYDKEAAFQAASGHSSRKMVMENLLTNSAKVLAKVQKDRATKKRLQKDEM
jgi:hypothetical protein